MKRAILAITMGDPASVGPELSIKALSDPAVYDACRPLIVGDACVLEETKRRLGSNVTIHAVQAVKDALFVPGTIDVLDMQAVEIDQLAWGKVSAMAGHAAFLYVQKAIELAMANEVDGTVTNALSKEAIHLAGHNFAGHTEIYAHYTHTPKYTMMLADGPLRVVHVSTHVSLREACDRVKKERVLEVIRIANDACKELGIEAPKVGVAGLNPHAGENGMFGREEIEEIRPAIEAACAEGILAEGPIPPDTVFSKARGGWYDIVVAMYHDQGHIPLKVVGFVYDPDEKKWEAIRGVNVTLGLPIVRTSVDHGTAFDQVGTGEANELSLKNAIETAIAMAQNR